MSVSKIDDPMILGNSLIAGIQEKSAVNGSASAESHNDPARKGSPDRQIPGNGKAVTAGAGDLVALRKAHEKRIGALIREQSKRDDSIAALQARRAAAHPKNGKAAHVQCAASRHR